MITNNEYRNFRYILRYYLFKIIPPVFYGLTLKYKYKKELNSELNLKNPVKLSEKIQRLKLNDNSPQKSMFADKLAAKKYVAENIPDLKTAKVYQACSSFKELNFDKLPHTFVLKTNHAWKTNVFINNKNQLTNERIERLKSYYDWALKINYAYWSYYELQYNNIKPAVYAEEFLYNNDKIKLIEYEVYCFNGTPEFVRAAFTVKNINCDCYKVYYYDTNYNPVDFVIKYGHNDKTEKSKNFDKIIKYSKILSKDFKFVRVDFMEAGNEIYFAEMTFTPYSGFIKFVPYEYDFILGSRLKLNK